MFVFINKAEKNGLPLKIKLGWVKTVSYSGSLQGFLKVVWLMLT